MSNFSSNDDALHSVFRRDPRTEWIARNRLHPLHDSVVSAQQGGEVRGPTGLLRKNPHVVGFIGPNGLKRIDRANGSFVAIGGKKRVPSAQDSQRPLHLVENPEGYIMVVGDMIGGRLTSHDKDILGLAHQLAAEKSKVAVVLVCFGENKETQCDLAGVDRVIHLEDNVFEGFAPEARLSVLQQIETSYQPMHWLFPDSVHGGSDLGSRLAARLGERPATQAWQVTSEKTISRGASGSQDISRTTPRILMLMEECANGVEDTRHEALPLALEYDVSMAEGDHRLIDQGQIDVDSNAVPLAEAEFILSAGNGIHNWDQFHSAAAALRATEGASRVAVDDGFMPRSRQVGASGTWVTARVYLAVGISGAIQHMQGIGQCDKVVAINTDAGCDMVKRADLAVIADSEAILAELTRLAQQRELSKEEEESDAA